jgi:hypothetical protein
MPCPWKVRDLAGEPLTSARTKTSTAVTGVQEVLVVHLGHDGSTFRQPLAGGDRDHVAGLEHAVGWHRSCPPRRMRSTKMRNPGQIADRTAGQTARHLDAVGAQSDAAISGEDARIEPA